MYCKCNSEHVNGCIQMCPQTWRPCDGWALLAHDMQKKPVPREASLTIKCSKTKSHVFRTEWKVLETMMLKVSTKYNSKQDNKWNAATMADTFMSWLNISGNWRCTPSFFRSKCSMSRGNILTAPRCCSAATSTDDHSDCNRFSLRSSAWEFWWICEKPSYQRDPHVGL